jgi:cobalt/nickel transport system permease protein
MLGASFVEAAITALGLAYLQKSYPEILLRRQKRRDEAEPVTSSRNPWIPAGALAATAVIVIFVAGLIKGGGSIGEWAGLDWSTVSKGDFAATILVSAVVTAIVLPLLFVALRSARAWRAPIMIFAGILIWVPIGLIAPGGAFAEEQSATPAEVSAAVQAKAQGDSSLFDALPDINQECACVPNNINDVGFSGGTVLAGYQPPWVSASDPAWQQNVGYQFAGFAGMAALALVVFAIYRVARWLVPSAPPDWRTAE